MSSIFKTISIVVLIPLSFFSCSKNDSNFDSSSQNVVCKDEVHFTSIDQENNEFTFCWNGEYKDVEIAYTPILIGEKPDKGRKKVVFGKVRGFALGFTGTVTNKDLGVNAGESFYFFVRAKCENGEFTKWSVVKRVDVESECHSVRNMKLNDNVSGVSLTWQTDFKKGTFEIEYGISGFLIGKGKRIEVVNEKRYGEFILIKNRDYDFHIRTYCKKNNDWSIWKSIIRQKVSKHQYLCKKPKVNSIYPTRYNNVTKVVFKFNSFGNKTFEYIVLSRGEKPTGLGTKKITITDDRLPLYLFNERKYDFYLRTICKDGTTTDWSEPFPVDT